jgi:hypothetical protein
LEYLAQNFPNYYRGYKHTIKILTVNGRFPIGKSIFAILEAPIEWKSEGYPCTRIPKKGVNNLFVQVEIGTINFPVFPELGTRPFVRQVSGTFGLSGYYGNFDRFEDFKKNIAFCFPSATLRHFSLEEV